MKFKKNIVVAHLLLGAFCANSAQAKITGVRASNNGSGSGGGEATGSVTVKDSRPLEENTKLQAGTASAQCGMDPAKSPYFPLDFFREITRDGSVPTFSVKENNKIVVNMPAVLDGCGKFKPVLHQNEKTKDVTIMMTLDNGIDSKWKYSQFETCLKEKKILVDGKIDHSKLEGKNYSQYSHTLDFNFNKKDDIKKTVKMTFGSPVSMQAGTDAYPGQYGIDQKVTSLLPSNLCVVSENITEKPVYLNKGQDVLIEEINDICKAGDAQKIAEAKTTLGNADALKDIADKIKAEIDGGYLVAVKKDVEKLEAEMALIENKVLKEQENISEATIKKEAAKYAELAKQLDSKFLNPAIQRIYNLMEERQKTKDPSAELDAIDKEIAELNKDVRRFAERSIRPLEEAMEKFAVNDSAKVIEEIRLKSYLYSKVNVVPSATTGSSISFEEADKRQRSSMKSFERILNDRTDLYLVSHGNMFPYQKTSRERQAVYTKMNTRWANFQKKEQSDYRKYCAVGMMGSVKNPVQCKSFISNAQRRQSVELRKRESDLRYIKGRNDKLGRMEKGYTEFQERKAAEREAAADEYDSYGSSYSSYEDSFQDRFPEYFGSQDQSGYDSSMFSMMGGQGMMGQQGMMGMPGMMGQQGMMGMQQPMMMGQGMMGQQGMMGLQQPMMMQQPMMQQQYGGWPGM